MFMTADLEAQSVNIKILYPAAVNYEGNTFRNPYGTMSSGDEFERYKKES